jgi:hypothetical protein
VGHFHFLFNVVTLYTLRGKWWRCMRWCHDYYHELGQEAFGGKWGTLGCGAAAAHCGGRSRHGNRWQIFGEVLWSDLQNKLLLAKLGNLVSLVSCQSLSIIFVINLLTWSANSGPYRELPSHYLSMGSTELLTIKGIEDPLYCRHWVSTWQQTVLLIRPNWNLRHCGSRCTPIFLCTVVCRDLCGYSVGVGGL